MPGASVVIIALLAAIGPVLEPFMIGWHKVVFTSVIVVLGALEIYVISRERNRQNREVSADRHEAQERFEVMIQRFEGQEKLFLTSLSVQRARGALTTGVGSGDLRRRALDLAEEVLRFLDKRQEEFPKADFWIPGLSQTIVAGGGSPRHPFDLKTEQMFRAKYGEEASRLRREFAEKKLHDEEWDGSDQSEVAEGNRRVYAAVNGLRALAEALDRR